MSDFLQIENVYKHYDRSSESKLVLENINFSLAKSEFVVILGPSGCGKTTLLKIVAGFLKTEKGAVYQNGAKITGTSPERIMIFQEFSQLFPWKTVMGNVVFALDARNITRQTAEKKKLARYYLKKVGLADVYDYYPHQLSGGMKQRVALARTLAADPEIMLMDEPFGSLDGQTRAGLQDLLLEIWQENQKTILFVTHDLKEAIYLADRIIVMGKDPGQIIKIVNNDLKRPRNIMDPEFTRLFETLSRI